MSFGPWIFAAFRTLAALRRLRGGPLDVFGYTTERRMERALIREYKDLIRSLLVELTPTNHNLSAEIAGLRDDIRGYGHIKNRSVARVRAHESELLGQLQQSTTLAA
jgi:indolepyruvate ferredoxin oxidoreductase